MALIDTTQMRFWCHKILPLTYDDSLSYYEVLAKTVKKLNEVIENDSAQNDIIEEVQEGYEGFDERISAVETLSSQTNTRLTQFIAQVDSDIDRLEGMFTDPDSFASGGESGNILYIDEDNHLAWGNVSIPSGGTTGQVMTKNSDEDFDADWETPHYIPSGGSTGHVLKKSSGSDYDVEWGTTSGIPSGGTTGQALVKSSNTDYAVGWADVSGGGEPIAENRLVPSGGSSGAILSKASSTDFDTQWIASDTQAISGSTKPITSGAVYSIEQQLEGEITELDSSKLDTSNYHGLPTGGTTGQVLKKTASANYSADWSAVHEIPSGGTTGQVLKKSSNSDFAVEWGDGGGGTPLPTGGHIRDVLTVTNKAGTNYAWRSNRAYLVESPNAQSGTVGMERNPHSVTRFMNSIGDETIGSATVRLSMDIDEMLYQDYDCEYSCFFTCDNRNPEISFSVGLSVSAGSETSLSDYDIEVAYDGVPEYFRGGSIVEVSARVLTTYTDNSDVTTFYVGVVVKEWEAGDFE